MERSESSAREKLTDDRYGSCYSSLLAHCIAGPLPEEAGYGYHHPSVTDVALGTRVRSFSVSGARTALTN